VSLAIRPLHPTLGAEVTGVALADLEAPDLPKLVAAWRRFGLLVFRRQRLTPYDQLRFSRAFGALDLARPFDAEQSALDSNPEIAAVSNIEQKGIAVGELGDRERAWHSDMTYTAKPPVGCVLHVREAPARGGGDTCFLDLRAAWDDLHPVMQGAASGMRVFHDRANTSAGTPRREGGAATGAWHPVRFDDPLSGKPILFLARRRGSRATLANGGNGDPVLAALWSAADNPIHIYRHVWMDGDVVLWNNLATMHRRDAFGGAERRFLPRTQIRALDPRWAN
jgi:taurine dioxygenase